MYASGSSVGARTLIWVPSITPTTPGNPPSSNTAFMASILRSTDKHQSEIIVFFLKKRANNIEVSGKKYTQ